MKRLLLVASLPLTTCASKTSSSSYTYVDTTHFDDGGYEEQACVAAHCATYPDGPACTSVTPFDLGVARVGCGSPPGGGRRPAELVRADTTGREAVGRWLAEAAQLEAASVPAFEILARELTAHDAPRELVARALAAADDERRHARIMSSWARAHGATPGPVRVIVREPRELEAIA